MYNLRHFCLPKSLRFILPLTKVDIFKDGAYTIEKVEPRFDNLKETWATGSLIRQGGTAAEFLAKHLISRKKEDGLKVLYKVYNMGEDGLGYRYILGPQRDSAFRGKFYSGIPLSIKEDVIAGKHSKEKPVPNLLYNFLAFEGEFGNCRTEGDVDIEGGKKPEQLLKFLIEYFSNEGDIVMDFFAGSGTTGAVAHKMKRQYILCEQIDAQIELIKKRLCSVIAGDQTGISSEVSWQGGGSFVYCELAKLNQVFMDEIQRATTEEELLSIYAQIIKTGFISCKVNPMDIDISSDEYTQLSIVDKKRFLMEILDKNLLYINLCDIDDAEFDISEGDKRFTKSFYREG